MGVMRVSVRAYAGTSAIFNVYSIRTPNDGYEDAQDVVDYLGNAYNDHIKPGTHNTVAYVDCLVQPVAPAVMPGVVVVPSSFPFNGGEGGALLPLMNAAVINFSVLTAKPNRGRKFLGGFAGSQWTGVNWHVTLMNRLNDFATELVGMPDLLGPGYEYIAQGKTAAGNFIYASAFTQYSIAPYARTQRRRRPGVGI